MIQNPILKGFNPDPCICRRGDDFYLAVSTFEWFPGVPVYHSRDLKNWELYTHILTDDVKLDLKKLPSAKGIWAPCLTWCEQEGLFYLIYGVMNSMNARYFDVNNYLITAPDITGPWSDPVYLSSSGFDASILHDDDGRKYIVALDWETRENYEKPGVICVGEYDPKQKKMIGYTRRVWRGGTDRGCIEAPHLTKKNGKYYLMCAEGGTGYNHSVTMARADSPFGPFEGDPENPIVTSQPKPSNERADWDHLKPRYFNPDSVLQKSGHGSYIDLPNGETYLAHLTSRPFVPELRCTLGRETALQKMVWTEDGWLRMANGGRLAQLEVEEPNLPEVPLPKTPDFDDFDSPVLGNFYYAPRQMPSRFVDLTSRPGWLRIRGEESLCSLNKTSLLCRKLTSVYARATVKMEFEPEVYQHSAGLVVYYDNMNYVTLRKYYSETLGCPALLAVGMENGVRTQDLEGRIPAPIGPVWMRAQISGRKIQLFWSADNAVWVPIGPVYDTTKLSDEYCKYGEFTGTMIGVTCEDRAFHRRTADFDSFEYVAREDFPVD